MKDNWQGNDNGRRHCWVKAGYLHPMRYLEGSFSHRLYSTHGYCRWILFQMYFANGWIPRSVMRRRNARMRLRCGTWKPTLGVVCGVSRCRAMATRMADLVDATGKGCGLCVLEISKTFFLVHCKQICLVGVTHGNEKKDDHKADWAQYTSLHSHWVFWEISRETTFGV